MSTSQIPSQVDHVKLAREGGNLGGFVRLEEMDRLLEYVARREGEIAVDLSFSRSVTRDNPDLPCIDILGTVRGQVELACQNCLESVDHQIDISIEIQVASIDEKVAEYEDLNLLLWPADQVLDLRDLIEDELILELPMVPRHEDCSLGVNLSESGENTDISVSINAGEMKNHPFSELKQMVNKHTETNKANSDKTSKRS